MLCVLLLAMSAVFTAACGDSNSSGDGASSQADTNSAATGAPANGPKLKLMTIAAVGAATNDLPQVPAGAKAAALAINKAGGVDGKQIESLACNDNADPNKAATCAREAASEKVVAVTGMSSLYSSRVYPVLQASDIVSVGAGPGNPADFTAADNYPLNGAAVSEFASAPWAAAKANRHRLAIVGLDIAQVKAQGELVKQGAKNSGVTITGTTYYPASTTDFAPYAQAIKKQNADSVIFVADPHSILQVMSAAKQVGIDPLWIFEVNELQDQVENFASLATNNTVVSAVPLTTAPDTYPSVKRYLADLDAAKDAGEIDNTTANGSGYNAWMSVYAAAAIAKTIHGAVTAQSFKAALKQAGDVDIDGMMTWTPNKSGPTIAPRVSNGDVYFGTLKDGKLVPLEVKPFDVFAAAGMS
jgi:ABC-type branched-subunit amino acid transport system substrate-binding protein